LIGGLFRRLTSNPKDLPMTFLQTARLPLHAAERMIDKLGVALLLGLAIGLAAAGAVSGLGPVA
jgi:hypothetical protein